MANHADMSRPAVIEAPLWVVWRVAYGLGCLYDAWIDGHNTETVNRRLAVFTAVLTALVTVLAAACAVALLT